MYLLNKHTIFLIVIVYINFCAPSDHIIEKLSELSDHVDSVTNVLFNISNQLALLQSISTTLQTIAHRDNNTGSSPSEVKSFIHGLSSNPILNLNINETRVPEVKRRGFEIFKYLSEYQRSRFVQAHCVNFECTSLCLHMVAGVDGCATQEILTIEGLSSGLINYRSPHYYGKCCGSGQFDRDPCYYYTPTAVGPMITCYHMHTIHWVD